MSSEIGGYKSICRRPRHLPGSLLKYSVNDTLGKVHNYVISTRGPGDVCGCRACRNNFLRSNRFEPSPPETSLAYRYDSINSAPPNSYPQYNARTVSDPLPRYNTGQKKQGPQGCTSCKTPDGDSLYPVLDPRFNLREVAKHMILLEDHLFQTKRRCDDCINKHRLTLEAFLEEALTLDKTGELRKLINDILTQFKDIMKEFVHKVRTHPVQDVDSVYCETAQKLRALRKPLCMTYSDYC